MERKLTAILSADVEGYSRLMGDDEEAKQLHIKEFKNQHREMGLDTRTPEAKVT